MHIKFRVAKKFNDKDWLEHHGEDGSQAKDYFIIFGVDEINFDNGVCYGECSSLDVSQNHCGDYDVVLENFDTQDGDVLMQYTGFNDKSGNEIYAGHIIKRKPLILGGDEIVGEVKMSDGCWFIDNGNDAVRLFTETCENEIIGNIYC